MTLSKKTKSNISYAPWDKWDPAKYLETYFHELRRDEDETLQFLVKNIQDLKGKRLLKVLEFGAGPTVVHALAAVPVASEIHLADYLQENLFEIQKWEHSDPGIFNWDPFTRRILELEGGPVTNQAVKDRNSALRRKLTKILLCDASLNFPLRNSQELYDLLIMTYCIDSATSSKDVWNAYMKNVLKLLAPKGTILVAALRNCQFYTVGNYYFPSANLNEEDLRRSFLDSGLKAESIGIEVRAVPECENEGYSSLLFAQASKA